MVFLRHIHRYFLYMLRHIDVQAVRKRLTYGLFPNPMPWDFTWAIHVPIQHRHLYDHFVNPSTTRPFYNTIGFELIILAWSWWVSIDHNTCQINCAIEVKTRNIRILRRAWGHEGPILLNLPGFIVVYSSQTKIIENFKFNFMRNDNENVFSKKITPNKMSWIVHQLGRVIVHMTSCLWRHNIFIRQYKPMKVAMEILLGIANNLVVF